MTRFASELRAIHKGLTAQGVPSRASGNGVVYYLPNRKLLVMHNTMSDGARALKNQRTICREAGLLWPLDPDFKNKLQIRIDNQVSKQGKLTS